MTKFYPYVVLKTNVSPKLLKYNIYIYNTVLNKAETAILFKDTAFKKIGDGLYQTKSIEIDSSKIGLDGLRDCVIILNLYRLTTSGQESLVMSHYIIPDKIESYPYQNHDKNKNIPVTKYVESTAVTKVVKGDVSKNNFELALNRNRIFQCIDPGCKPGEAKDPFSKAQIEAGLQSRLNEPFPDQDLASLCGPAAYFFCLINLSPSKYKLAVKQLWETGQTRIGELEIKPSLDGCRRVKNFYRSNGRPKIPSIDWIPLASLRESENKAFKLNDPSKEFAGITLWSGMYSWFDSSGFKIEKVFSFNPLGYNDDSVAGINRYAGDNYYVITLISASILDSGASSGTNILPDHWIVWTDKLRSINGSIVNEITDPATEVRLKLFSWGENRQSLRHKMSLSDFAKKVFYALVIKKERF
ncbi:hypothetical protein SOI71_12730 [Acinetobacter pittii]|uniref:Uncharacterized protein n=1 Tax=Acinetobacter pittii TaxID=48296 RepID=A0AB33BN84_ACIPI|nr:hypothetical protein [Acinetobacter pittii]AMX18689.1 hypothetical protein IEC338SC_1549 [Acinetobacter pittii]PPB99256.1 hypothetical protein ApiMCR53_16285 [Acinetobacter pittii]WPP76210.1 hypothetical protein SOI71_12730 [Acinetobacter pittii]